MQGDSSEVRRSARRSAAVLGVAHVLAATLTVAFFFQVGSVTIGRLPDAARLIVGGAVALLGVVVDLYAASKGRVSFGLRRQTAKELGHSPEREWWVTPLLWGLDTGLIWSTFRVSFASWVLIAVAAVNLAPPWAGLVYGGAFAVGLWVSLALRPARPLGSAGSDTGSSMRAAQGLGIAAMAGVSWVMLL